MTSLPVDILNGFQLLLDLAIKSVIVMLAAWALTKMLRNASAASRHWVWSLAVAGLLALPALSLALPGWQLGWLPAPTQNAASVPDAVTPVTIVEPATVAVSETPSAPVSRTLRFEIDAADAPAVKPPDNGWPAAIPSFVRSLNWGMTALMFWLVGAALVLARLLAGTAKVWRMAKLANRVTESGWLALAGNLATRLRLRGNVELRKSAEVRLPMTWGAWRSVVMLPVDADGWTPECRNIVLLHELAHVKRRDCLTQNLAQLACALYWFNPLVWLAAKQLHVERELACDDQVLEVGTKASDYAGHLVEIARSFQANPTLAPVTVGMACSQLESRVRAILDPGVRRRGLNCLSAAMIGLGAIGLVLALAVAQPWSKTTASPSVNILAEAPLFGISAQPVQTPTIQNQTQATPPGEKNQPQIEQGKNVESAEQVTATDSDDDEQDGQAKAQTSELTAEQLIQMKSAGVTPEFVEAMRKQGFDNLSVRDLTQLSIHGVNAEFIQQARNWGGDKVSVRDIVQLKIAGVTPEYFAAMKRAGFDNLSVRELAELRIHGVTPEFIEAMRRNGYDKLSAGQISSLKIHGIDEVYIREMQSWTGGKPTINELMQLKIHDVTPAFANRMKALGFGDLPIRKLTELKIHGVDEQFVKEMRDLGFDKLTMEQLLQMRIHGVNADYVRKMRAAGLKNVSVNQMIQMKITGVDSILLKEKR